MKKRNLFLSLLLALTVVGCNNTEKVLIDSTYEIDQAIEIDHETLNDKLECQDNFILYVHTEGCLSCLNFERNILNNYIENNEVDVYKASSSAIKGLIKTTSKFTTNPRLIVFKEGAIYKQTAYSINEEVFNSVEGLTNYLNQYIKVSSLKEINYEQLQVLLNDNNDKVIYYHWDECGDCAYLENHYLKEYLLNNEISNFYSFEVSSFRQYKNSLNDTDKQKYYDFLSMAKYEIDGNKGVVPTAIYLKNKKVADYMIYFNDEIESLSNGTLKVNKTSYGETEAEICKIYSSYDEYQRLTATYHNQKFKKFIENTDLVK